MRRKLFIAMIAIVLLGGAGLAWAEEKYQTVEVFFMKLNIYLNGVPFSQQRDVMIYNGNVYVPLKSLTDMLGAQTRWTDNNSSVSIDFMQDDRDLVFSAAQRGLYQYVAIEKRGITTDLAANLSARDWSGMKKTIDRIAKLQEAVDSIPDPEMAALLGKMRTSAEWIRTSYAANKISNAKMAWVLFGQNLDQLNGLLSGRISKTATDAKQAAAATSGASN